MEKCRLCYTDSKPEMCKHIFNTKFEPPIWKIIEQLSNLKITKNDPYTKNICSPCFNNLVKYSDFRMQILDTDYRILHEKGQLSEKTSDDCDYIEGRYTPTRSDNDDFMIKEEEVEIEEDPLKIEGESDEESNNSSIAVMDNQDTKEFVIVGRINNNDEIPACYTGPQDNSNETNESQSTKCSTEDKIDFNKDSIKTAGDYIISTNNNDLKFTDNNDKIISDENERSIAKNVGSGKNFYDNSSCTNSNNNNIKREESDVEMSNVGNCIYIKDETMKKNSESTTSRSKVRNVLNMRLKVQNSEKQSILQSHARKKNDERPLKSNICNKQSSDEANLCRPKQEHTVDKPFKCNVCNKQFSHKSIFRIHERVHTGEKPFKCHVCNKEFSQKSSFRIHERLHTGEKPFKCNICNKQFSVKPNLYIHERVHTGEKPYKCNICNKQFAHKGNLEYHERIHTGEKPFKCKICKKEFSHQASLKRHEPIHTGEKPYKCKMCNKSFIQRSHFDYHLRMHTGEKPFKCDVCNTEFTQKSSLTKHNSRMHAVEKS